MGDINTGCHDYPDRGYTSVTAGKRSRQASATRGQNAPTKHYPEVGSTPIQTHPYARAVVVTPKIYAEVRSRRETSARDVVVTPTGVTPR